jgi:D-arabinose 1-dehydrogenase-like Zn-dependent alcohol dehydrogenase
VRPGEWVAIFGVGAVGLAAVQIAAALGARVIAVSRTLTKLELGTDGRGGRNSNRR